jgi:hypothetical protein
MTLLPMLPLITLAIAVLSTQWTADQRRRPVQSRADTISRIARLLLIAAYALVPMALSMPAHAQETRGLALTDEERITRRERQIRQLEGQIRQANDQITTLDADNSTADTGYLRLKRQIQDPETIFVYFPGLKVFLPQDRDELAEHLQWATHLWGAGPIGPSSPTAGEAAERLLEIVVQASNRWKRESGAALLRRIQQYIETNRLKKVALNQQIVQWNNDIEALRKDIATIREEQAKKAGRPVESIVGTWSWFNDWTVEIRDNNSFSARNASGDDVGGGTWTGTPATGSYVLTWDRHPDKKTYVDKLQLKGGVLSGTNSVNLGLDPKNPFQFGTLIAGPGRR